MTGPLQPVTEIHGRASHWGSRETFQPRYEHINKFFHSEDRQFKNMFHMRTRTTKSLMVTGLASLLLFTSACGADSASKAADGNEASDQASETVIVDGVEYGPTIDGIPTLKELASDTNGVWRKSTILPDDPAFTVDPLVVEPTATEAWTEEDIDAANRIAVEMAVDAIDTAANGAPQDAQSRVDWWKANKDKFDPAWQQAIYNALIVDDPNMAVIFKGAHRISEDEQRSYGLVYGENEVHIKDRTIETTSIFAGPLEDETVIAVTVEVDYANVVDLDGDKTSEEAEAKITYHMAKDEETGKFLVTGIEPEYRFQQYE